MSFLDGTPIEEEKMKQPIWIRERTPPAPPPTPLQPVLKRRERGGKDNRGLHNIKRDPALIEMILMRYRLLLLIFSASILKP